MEKIFKYVMAVCLLAMATDTPVFAQSNGQGGGQQQNSQQPALKTYSSGPYGNGWSNRGATLNPPNSNVYIYGQHTTIPSGTPSEPPASANTAGVGVQW